jgi:hypothetical protein
LKDAAAEVSDQESPQDSSRYGHYGEHQSGTEVDTPHPAVGDRAGKGVEKCHRQRDAGYSRRCFIRIEKEQYRNQQEASGDSDKRPECPDEQADESQQRPDYCLFRPFLNIPDKAKLPYYSV